MPKSTSTNATRSTNNFATFPTPTQKPHTNKKVIAANVQLLVEQLEAGHSEGLTAYLTAMGRFHNYSFGNILEIARQCPTATRDARMERLCVQNSRSAPFGCWTPPPSQAPGPFPKTSSLGNAAAPRLGSSAPLRPLGVCPE